MDWKQDVIYGAVQRDKSKVSTFTVDTCEACGKLCEHPSTPLGTLYLNKTVRPSGKLNIGGGRVLTLVTEAERRSELTDDLGWCDALGCVTCGDCWKDEEPEPVNPVAAQREADEAQALDEADKADAYDLLLPLVRRLLGRVREADKAPRWTYSDTGAEGTTIEVETDALAGVLALLEED